MGEAVQLGQGRLRWGMEVEMMNCWRLSTVKTIGGPCHGGDQSNQLMSQKVSWFSTKLLYELAVKISRFGLRKYEIKMRIMGCFRKSLLAQKTKPGAVDTQRS